MEFDLALVTYVLPVPRKARIWADISVGFFSFFFLACDVLFNMDSEWMVR